MLGHYVKTGDLLRLSAGVFCSSNERLAVDFQWEDMVRIGCDFGFKIVEENRLALKILFQATKD